jgi:hypothetical protein
MTNDLRSEHRNPTWDASRHHQGLDAGYPAAPPAPSSAELPFLCFTTTWKD